MGITLIFLANIFFALSTFFGKLTINNSNMSGVINSFSRFFIGTIFMLVYMVANKKSFKLKDKNPVFLRGIFNSLAIILLSVSSQYTTITNSNMLHMTYPVFVILFSPYILKDKINKKTYLYLLLSMIGAYIVSNAGFNGINRGDIIALLSGLVASLSIICLSLSRRKNEGYQIVFYVMLIGSLTNLIFAYKDIINFDINALKYVILAGTTGVVGQILLTEGYKYVDAATGSLVSLSRIIISAVLGNLVLGEVISLKTVVGMILILISLIGASGYFDKKKTM